MSCTPRCCAVSLDARGSDQSARRADGNALGGSAAKRRQHRRSMRGRLLATITAPHDQLVCPLLLLLPLQCHHHSSQLLDCPMLQHRPVWRSAHRLARGQ